MQNEQINMNYKSHDDVANLILANTNISSAAIEEVLSELPTYAERCQRRDLESKFKNERQVEAILKLHVIYGDQIHHGIVFFFDDANEIDHDHMRETIGEQKFEEKCLKDAEKQIKYCDKHNLAMYITDPDSLMYFDMAIERLNESRTYPNLIDIEIHDLTEKLFFFS